MHPYLYPAFLCYTAPMAMVLDVRSTSRTKHGLLYMCEAHQEQSMACYKIRVKKQIEYGKIILYYFLYFTGQINYMRREKNYAERQTEWS